MFDINKIECSCCKIDFKWNVDEQRHIKQCSCIVGADKDCTVCHRCLLLNDGVYAHCICPNGPTIPI